MDSFFGCCWSWPVGLFLIYKILDWLIRLPFVRGRQNRFVLVTGCGAGFGHEIVKRLDASGCHVFAGCLREQSIAELRVECSSRLVPLLMDVSDPESVRKARREVEAKLPRGTGLWGLVNNAAIALDIIYADWRTTTADYRKCAEVNLFGLIDVTLTFLPLVKQAKGRVVNVSSVLGRGGSIGWGPYCMTKYGVEAFSECLRKELSAFGCRVNIVEPGYFKTDIFRRRSTGSHVNQPAPTPWDTVPDEVKKQYGEDYYEKANQQQMEFLKYIASERIGDVMRVYEHALFGLFPRGRYVVGWDARLVWIPLSWLPEWLGDWLHQFVDGRGPLVKSAVCQNKKNQ